jgi:hypothetical protein
MRSAEMEDVMKKIKTLDEQALLKKNPKAAKVLEQNRKKLGNRRPREQKEYGIGLPYGRPALVSVIEDDPLNENHA